jgi:2-polyprenyl-3-methyl-5-hydroxy-6-metoxy-1,4-benzoquinol methylase
MMMQMRVEHVPCPLCGSQDHVPWGRENGFAAVRCQGCGLLYVTPRPVADEIAEASRLGQHRTVDGALDVVAKRSHSKRRRYQSVIEKTFADVIAAKKPISWLDVGAGYGEVVDALLAVLPRGSTVDGIEPMAAKVKEARARGLPIDDTPLSEVTRRYDVISLVNVFGHIPDFTGFLAEIKACLEPGGELFLQTGNAAELPRRRLYPDPLSLPDHLVFAGEAQLRQFLERAGFAILSVERERTDTFGWFARSLAKRALGRPARVSLPYSSPFRTLYCRARSERKLQAA